MPKMEVRNFFLFAVWRRWQPAGKGNLTARVGFRTSKAAVESGNLAEFENFEYPVGWMHPVASAAVQWASAAAPPAEVRWQTVDGVVARHGVAGWAAARGGERQRPHSGNWELRRALIS